MMTWDAPSRWIGTILLVVIAFIGLDALLQALEANPENAIVAFVAAVAGFFLAPFVGMFPDQQYLLTALIAILGWSLFAALVTMVVQGVRGAMFGRRDRRVTEHRSEVERERETTPRR